MPELGLGLCGENKLAKAVPAMHVTGPFLNSYRACKFSQGCGSKLTKIIQMEELQRLLQERQKLEQLALTSLGVERKENERQRQGGSPHRPLPWSSAQDKK